MAIHAPIFLALQASNLSQTATEVKNKFVTIQQLTVYNKSERGVIPTPPLGPTMAYAIAGPDKQRTLSPIRFKWLLSSELLQACVRRSAVLIFLGILNTCTAPFLTNC